MARVNPIKNSNVAGELSPRLEGRDDLDQYFQGLRQAENGVVLPHGGFMGRSGSRFVAEVKDSSLLATIFPFKFSTEQAYVVEAGNFYFRFYANEAQLVDGVPVEVATPYTTAQIRDLFYAQEADVMYIVHPDHFPRKLTRTTATTFSLDKVVFTDGKAPLRAANTVSANTITVAAGVATAGTSPFVAGDVGRALRHKVTDEAWYEITAFNNSNSVDVTFKGGTSTDGDGASSDWSLGMFSDSEGPQAVTFHEGRLFYGGTADEPDRIAGSNSDSFDEFGNDATAEDNAIYRRMVSDEVNAIRWMASANETLTIGTSGGEFRLVAASGGDDVLTPASAKPVPSTTRGSVHVRPLVINNLVIFVQRNARKLRQFVFNLTEDSFRARDISILSEHVFDQGGVIQSAYQQDPDSVAWFVRGDGTLVGFTIEDEQQVIGAHRHIFGGSFGPRQAQCESIAVIPNPDETEDQLWVVVKRTINGVTKRYVEFVEKQFRPDITVKSTDVDRLEALNDAFFLDSALDLDVPFTVTAITSANPAVVTATSNTFSNGDTVRFSGVFGLDDTGGVTQINRFNFLVANKSGDDFELQNLDGTNFDSTGLTAYDSEGEVREVVTTVSGLSHLEGETVGILGDGAVQPRQTVTSGAVTLSDAAARVTVGLPYRPLMESQRFVVPGRLGTTQGQAAKIRRVNVRVHNTVGMQIGVGPNPIGDKLENVNFRFGGFQFNAPPLLFSGDVDRAIESDYTDTPTVFIAQEDPLPITVLAIMPEMESHERD